MDTWLISFIVGFMLGLLFGLRLWWVQRARRIEAERLLRVSLGQIAQRVRR